MTPEGIPETEREATLAGLDDVTARELTAEALDGRLSLVEAAETCGVPVLVMQRWCGDGTVPAESFAGRAERPGSLRIERAWVVDFLERGEVAL